MHQPADVGGQLLGFGTGEQHAVVECVQKAALGNPAAPFHQFRMHHRNLPCRAAETDASQLEPEGERLPEAD
jgi:hypothetical protein